MSEHFQGGAVKKTQSQSSLIETFTIFTMADDSQFLYPSQSIDSSNCSHYTTQNGMIETGIGICWKGKYDGTSHTSEKSLCSKDRRDVYKLSYNESSECTGPYQVQNITSNIGNINCSGSHLCPSAKWTVYTNPPSNECAETSTFHYTHLLTYKCLLLGDDYVLQI